MKTRLTTALAVGALGLGLTACGGDPTEGEKSATDTITVGSAAFPENEIIAEIYAQALEAKGVKVEKKLNIGAREAYIPALENGEIDLLPEYTGNLLLYLDKDATATAATTSRRRWATRCPRALEILEVVRGRGQGLAQRHAGALREGRRQDHRRPEEDRRAQARREPGVQGASVRPARPGEGLRHHRRQVHRHQRRRRTRHAEGAARRQGRRREHLLHDAVDPREQARHAGGPEEPDRGPERRAADQQRQGVRRGRRGAQRRLGRADDRGPARPEQQEPGQGQGRAGRAGQAVAHRQGAGLISGTIGTTGSARPGRARSESLALCGVASG